ncbi:MAG: hypothetical protein QXN35_03445 [Ignisphaera sp.]
MNNKPKLGQRMIRALFVGSTVGMIGGLGLYMMARAVNLIADAPVFDEMAFLVLGLGGALVAAVGIELSKDMG